MEGLKQLLKDKLREHGVPGAALVVLSDGATEIIDLGFISAGESVPVGDDTLFQVGSVTKVFTALAVCRCVGEGRLSLDSQLSEVLTGVDVSPAIGAISIRSLLTHRSGLPRLPDNFIRYMGDARDPYRGYGIGELYAYLKLGGISRGSDISYSNLGYGLLGVVVERVLGGPLGRVLGGMVGEVYGMRDSFLYTGEDTAGYHFARGHDKEGRLTCYWNMNILSGAGGFVSSASDMGRFLRATVASVGGGGWMAEALRPLSGKMAWGWFGKGMLPPSVGGRRLWHNGMTGGFSSYMEIDVELKRGFCLLLNRSVEPGSMGEAVSRVVMG